MQGCDCNVIGTIGNQGCDKQTGACLQCKSNVIGEKCESCKPGYYGLSAYYDSGCVKCNCVAGFSYSNYCNQETGQCSCKPNVYGKRCNIIEDGFYCANIDHLLFEAENSIRMNNLSQILEKHEDYLKSPGWTGLGYLKVFENGKLKFKFNHDFETGMFDLVLRYKVEFNWENVHVRVFNLGPDGSKPIYLSSYVNKTCFDMNPFQNRIEEKMTKIEKCWKNFYNF